MKISLFPLLLLASLCPELVVAESPGEIISVTRDGKIRFFSGDLKLTEGEEVRTQSGYGEATYFLRITSSEPPYSEAQLDRLQVSGDLRPLSVGQKIVLEVPENTITSVGFIAGTNGFNKVGDFGGNQWGIGLQCTFPLRSDLFVDFRLQADSMGKDANGIEKRRSSYVVDIGTRYKGFLFGLGLGVVDTMTITTDVANASTVFDPYTGAVYPTRGVEHNYQFGYRVGASYPFVLKAVTRNSRSGFALTPTLSYLDTFSSTAYRGYWSLGASIDLIFN